MEFFSKLKGQLFESDGQATTPQQAPAPKGALPHAPAPQGTPYVPSGPVLNRDMFEAIRKATFTRNTALTALITASDMLKDIIPDPVMRLKAAQKTAGAGRSAKEISEAVSIHLNDVDGEVLRFAQMLQNKIGNEVGGLNKQGDALESDIKRMDEETQRLAQRIQELQAGIAQKSTDLGNIRSQASLREAELRQSEEEFTAAANAVREELNGHKNTILSTLG